MIDELDILRKYFNLDIPTTTPKLILQDKSEGKTIFIAYTLIIVNQGHDLMFWAKVVNRCNI